MTTFILQLVVPSDNACCTDVRAPSMTKSYGFAISSGALQYWSKILSLSPPKPD